MSRKVDPIVGVLRFFETASLEAAGMALALVKATVKRRTPAVVVVKRRRVAKSASQPPQPPQAQEQPAPIPPPPLVAPVSPSGTRKPRQRMHAAPSRLELEQDVALPGIGPATIGE